MKDTAILITARLKSKRLPKKLLRKIEKIPMIEHLIDRLKKSKKIKKIILCTSTNIQDDQLEIISKKKKISCFRGSEDDVLHRLYSASIKYNIKNIVNCTADNPFVDPVYIDKAIVYHIKNKNDFTDIPLLPWGTFSYCLTVQALDKVCKIKNSNDTEYWHNYFHNTNYFKKGSYNNVAKKHVNKNLRLTVDTKEDLKLIRKIFRSLYKKNKVFTLDEIILLLKKNPELIKINNKVKQKKPKIIKLKKKYSEKKR